MFMARIHQGMSTYHIQIFGSGLSHFGKCFYFHPFSSKIQDIIFFPLISTLISRSVTISLFILPLTGCFQVLAIANNSVMNIVEQMLLQDDWASLGYIPKTDCWILRQFDSHFSEILPLCFPKQLHYFANPPARYECFPYSTYSPAKVITGVLNLAILTGVRWYL